MLRPGEACSGGSVHRRLALSLPILTLCAVASPIWAKHKAVGKTSATGVPVISVSSRLVVLDVVVLNRKKPVCGLKKQDFSVLEEKRNQPIGFFESHCGRTEMKPAGEGTLQAPVLPPNTYANLPLSRVTDSVTVLLLDGLNTQVADSQYLRLQMLQYLKNLPAGRRIAIFALGSQLRMLQGFTTDSGLLLAAIRSSKFTPAASLLPPADQAVEERQETDTLAAAGVSAQTIADLTNFMDEADTQQLGMRVDMTMNAMQAMARYLSGIPGRKNLIWFSGSFPVEFYSTVDLPTGLDPTVITGSFENQLKQTAELLAAARVAVYPVDVRGVLVDPMYDASVNSDYGAVINGVPVGEQRFSQDAKMADLQRIEEHGTMDLLAKETGGRAVYNSNALQEAVADALSDGENFYTLAYVPRSERFDGRWRKIKVSVLERPQQGRYTLLYRHGYYATNGTPEKPVGKNLVSQGFVAAMQDGVPPASQILFKARVVSPGPNPPSGPVLGGEPKMPGRAARYVIDYAVSLRHLGLAMTAQGEHKGELVVEALAYNDDGKIVNWASIVAPITLNAAAWNVYAEDGIQIHQVMDLPKGRIHLRLGVYDPVSGGMGTMEIPLTVGTEKGSTVATAKQ